MEIKNTIAKTEIKMLYQQHMVRFQNLIETFMLMFTMN